MAEDSQGAARQSLLGADAEHRHKELTGSHRQSSSSINGGDDSGADAASRKNSHREQTQNNDGVKSIIMQICLFILVTELCERLAYYGLTGSLPVFFSKVFNISHALSTEINTLFSAINYVTPLLGAFIADKYAGRFRTIGMFCVVYVVGMVLCVIGAVPNWTSWNQPIFFIGLFGGVAVGSGGIKPNVVVLGADQFDLSKPEEVKQKDRFFNYFYWCINIGAAIAFGALANLAANGAPPVIPEEWGFFVSFVIPATAMLLAVVAFYSGARRVRCCGGRCVAGGYKMLPPKSSALGAFVMMFGRAATQTPAGRIIIAALVSLVVGFVATIASYFISEDDQNTTSSEGIQVGAHFVVAVVGMCCILFACMVFILVGARADWMHAGYQRWANKRARETLRKHDGRGGDGRGSALSARLVGEGTGSRSVSYGAAGDDGRRAAQAVTMLTVGGEPSSSSTTSRDPSSTSPGNAPGSRTNSTPAGASLDQFQSMPLLADDDDAPPGAGQDLLDACEVVRLLPYFAYMVVFWAVYGQMNNNFTVQGCQMNLFWVVDPAVSTKQVGSRGSGRIGKSWWLWQ
jgi:dipeptide/tripeptide permease